MTSVAYFFGILCMFQTDDVRWIAVVNNATTWNVLWRGHPIGDTLAGDSSVARSLRRAIAGLFLGFGARRRRRTKRPRTAERGSRGLTEVSEWRIYALIKRCVRHCRATQVRRGQISPSPRNSPSPCSLCYSWTFNVKSNRLNHWWLAGATTKVHTRCPSRELGRPSRPWFLLRYQAQKM